MTEIATVIAVTGEDDRFEPVREAGIGRARDTGATLILYDLDATPSLLESPLPTNWSAEGTEQQVGDRLDPRQLHAAGHEAVAEQVELARMAGVDAWGWLPKGQDGGELATYANRQPNPLVLVPSGDDDLASADIPGVEVVEADAAR